MATMQFPSILQYEGPQLDVGGNFAQGMQTGILRQQNERAQAEEARAQAEFEQKQSDREKMQGILEAMGPDATPEEIANSLLAVDPEMANKYMDLAIDKESLASERLGQQTERLRQQSVNFEMISKKQAQDRLNYKEQKTTATAWSKNFADTLSSIIDPVEKKKAQEALVKSAEADNQNRVQMGLKPIEIPEAIKSGDPDKAAAFAQEIATIGQQQLDMLRKAEIAGMDPTAEIKNYEYGLENPEFAKQLTDSAPMGETRALIQQLIDEGSASSSQEALEIIKGGASVAGKAKAENIVEYKNFMAAVPALETVASDLYKLSEAATYNWAGKSADTVKRELGVDVGSAADARAKYENKVRVEILPILKSTFGAQFTVKEGEWLLSTLGDINKSPSEKKAAIDARVEGWKNFANTLALKAGETPPEGIFEKVGVDDKGTTGTDTSLSPEEQAELDELRKRFGK